MIKELVKEGYSESKTEAVRTALILYAVQLGLISKRKLRRDALNSVRDSGKEYSDAEITKMIDSAR